MRCSCIVLCAASLAVLSVRFEEEEALVGSAEVRSVRDKDAFALVSSGSRSVPHPTPRLGSQPILVILAEFPDYKGVFTGKDWHNRFFGASGFDEYFQYESYGQLSYHGDVVGLWNGTEPVVNDDSVSYVTMPEPMAFYAAGHHGFKTDRCSRKNLAGVAHDALKLLDAASFDFSPYKNAEDVLENVFVIAASRSFYHENDKDNSFLSTAVSFKPQFQTCKDASFQVHADGSFLLSSGLKVGDFTFATGRTDVHSDMAAPGVFRHEQGHALGIFDEYGTGPYSIMGDSGLWLNDGKSPAHFSAWDKMILGWLSPQVAAQSDEEIEYTLKPSDEHPDALRIDIADSEEYFIIENRQQLAYKTDNDEFPSFCPGLLIWHVDGAMADSSSSLWHWNQANQPATRSEQGHVAVALSTADPVTGWGKCSDTIGASTGTYKVKLHGDSSQDGFAATVRVVSDADHSGTMRVAISCPNCGQATTTTNNHQASFEECDGYIGAGDNIHPSINGAMTVEAAQTKCFELEECAGFTFANSAVNPFVAFKSKYSCHGGSGSGWTSFKLLATPSTATTTTTTTTATTTTNNHESSFEKCDGYSGSGDNILPSINGAMTVEAAQTKCSELEGCAGFTFANSDVNPYVVFKSKYTCWGGAASGWTSFKLLATASQATTTATTTTTTTTTTTAVALATPTFSKCDGYIPGGGNITDAAGSMSVDEAKEKCASLPDCVGFTFYGQSSSPSVHFKTKWSCYGAGSGWWSYRLVPADGSVPAALAEATADERTKEMMSEGDMGEEGARREPGLKGSVSLKAMR